MAVSNTLKFDDVIGVILREEMRWKSIGETSGNTLIVDNRGRQKERGKSLDNHGKFRKDICKSRARVEFWNYGNKWHLNKDYGSQKGKKGDGQNENAQEENVIGDVLQDDLILSVENIINF